MEDAHAIVPSLDQGDSEEQSNAFFAVYDGHGGDQVAKFAGRNVHKRLLTEEAFRQKHYEEALKRAFIGTDEDFLADPNAKGSSGCTAVAALVTNDNKIYVANAGDSRSVISVKGKVKPLSFDHKPVDKAEKARIYAAGGYIEDGRVHVDDGHENKNLAMSRALGDFICKNNRSLPPEQQVVTANPDVTVHDITEEDEFLIIACDGIWDCLSSQQAVDFVRLTVSEGKELTEITEMICDHCMAPDTSCGLGMGTDNMTVLIVAILGCRTKEEWYSWITDRVKQNYGHATPTTLPQLYSKNRITSFKARQAIEEQARKKEKDSSVDAVAVQFQSLGRNIDG
jgi:protein phosphatase 2C family protein 2/3